MSLFKREPALLALGRRRHAWWPGGTPLESVTIADTGADEPESLLVALNPRSSGAKRGIEIILDDALARFYVVRPPDGVRNLAELRAVVTARFEDLFGFESATWRLEADWHARLPFLVCAVPISLLQMLRGALPATRSIAPAFVHCVADAVARRSNGWLLHATTDHVTAARLDARGVTHVGSAALPVDLGAWLAEQALLSEEPYDIVYIYSVETEVPALAVASAFRPDALSRALQLVGALGRQRVPA